MGEASPTESISENLVIALPIPEPTTLIKRLQDSLPNIKIQFFEQKLGSPDPFKPDIEIPQEMLKDATVLYTMAGTPRNPKQDAPKLELVQLFSAGADFLVKHPIYGEPDITLATSSGVHGPQIAEWVIMTALVYSHDYQELHDCQKEHRWINKIADINRLHDMVGQRIGILGYGGIGRQVGRVAKALGMDVVAYTASPKNTKEAKKDTGYIVNGTGDPEGEIPSAWFSGLDRKSLHEFLGQDLDMLLISVPLTDETHHFIGADEFSVLKKKKAFISNISRGQIVDQEAMIAALRSGDLRGAALDVTDPEPLPKDNPLWDMPNVVITPHISGISSAYAERSFAILEGNLRKKAKGEPLWNVVDRKRGY